MERLVAEFLADQDGVLRAETRSPMLTLSSRGAAGIAPRVGVGFVILTNLSQSRRLSWVLHNVYERLRPPKAPKP